MGVGFYCLPALPNLTLSAGSPGGEPRPTLFTSSTVTLNVVLLLFFTGRPALHESPYKTAITFFNVNKESEVKSCEGECHQMHTEYRQLSDDDSVDKLHPHVCAVSVANVEQ